MGQILQGGGAGGSIFPLRPNSRGVALFVGIEGHTCNSTGANFCGGGGGRVGGGRFRGGGTFPWGCGGADFLIPTEVHADLSRPPYDTMSVVNINRF